MRGGCSQPPGTRSALAVTLTGSAAAVESTIATAKIGTFRISLPLSNCAQLIGSIRQPAWIAHPASLFRLPLPARTGKNRTHS
jgi:hypothetical protein